MYLFDYIKRIEERKGRKLDLNKRRDLFILADMMEMEIKQREAKLMGIRDVLEGYKTYNPKEQKPIQLSHRDRYGY